LLGRAEQSSPEAAERRAAGAGLDGDDADQAIIAVAVMRFVFVSFPENACQTRWRTGSSRPSIRPTAAMPQKTPIAPVISIASAPRPATRTNHHQ